MKTSTFREFMSPAKISYRNKEPSENVKLIGGVALTRYILSTYVDSNNARKRLSSNGRKVTKYNLRIISKPHARLQTMTKRPVKFQKN